MRTGHLHRNTTLFLTTEGANVCVLPTGFSTDKAAVVAAIRDEVFQIIFLK